MQRRDIVKLLDFSFGGRGLIKGARLMEVLKEMIGDYNIEDLPVGFTAVATAAKEKKEVWLNSGPLFDAIRASIAIPMVFTPHEYRGKELLDGALINPMPIAPTLGDGTDLTVAVDLNGKSDPSLESPGEGQKKGSADRRYFRRLSKLIDLKDLDEDGDRESQMGLFEVAAYSFDTVQTIISRLKMAAYSPDVVIGIPGNLCAFFEFYRATEVIDYGQLKAEQVLAEKQLLDPKRKRAGGVTTLHRTG